MKLSQYLRLAEKLDLVLHWDEGYWKHWYVGSNEKTKSKAKAKIIGLKDELKKLGFTWNPICSRWTVYELSPKIEKAIPIDKNSLKFKKEIKDLSKYERNTATKMGMPLAFDEEQRVWYIDFNDTRSYKEEIKQYDFKWDGSRWYIKHITPSIKKDFIINPKDKVLAEESSVEKNNGGKILGECKAILVYEGNGVFTIKPPINIDIGVYSSQLKKMGFKQSRSTGLWSITKDLDAAFSTRFLNRMKKDFILDMGDESKPNTKNSDKSTDQEVFEEKKGFKFKKKLKFVDQFAKLFKKNPFRDPFEGPNGNKVIAYEWIATEGDVSDGKGGLIPGLISDWENAEECEHCGKKIVHLFTVLDVKTREKQTYGINHAHHALGFTRELTKEQIKKILNGSGLLSVLKSQEEEFVNSYYKALIKRRSSSIGVGRYSKDNTQEFLDQLEIKMEKDLKDIGVEPSKFKVPKYFVNSNLQLVFRGDELNFKHFLTRLSKEGWDLINKENIKQWLEKETSYNPSRKKKALKHLKLLLVKSTKDGSFEIVSNEEGLDNFKEELKSLGFRQLLENNGTWSLPPKPVDAAFKKVYGEYFTIVTDEKDSDVLLEHYFIEIGENLFEHMEKSQQLKDRIMKKYLNED